MAFSSLLSSVVKTIASYAPVVGTVSYLDQMWELNSKRQQLFKQFPSLALLTRSTTEEARTQNLNTFHGALNRTSIIDRVDINSYYIQRESVYRQNFWSSLARATTCIAARFFLPNVNSTLLNFATVVEVGATVYSFFQLYTSSSLFYVETAKSKVEESDMFERSFFGNAFGKALPSREQMLKDAAERLEEEVKTASIELKKTGEALTKANKKISPLEKELSEKAPGPKEATGGFEAFRQKVEEEALRHHAELGKEQEKTSKLSKQLSETKSKLASATSENEKLTQRVIDLSKEITSCKEQMSKTPSLKDIRAATAHKREELQKKKELLQTPNKPISQDKEANTTGQTSNNSNSESKSSSSSGEPSSTPTEPEEPKTGPTQAPPTPLSPTQKTSSTSSDGKESVAKPEDELSVLSFTDNTESTSGLVKEEKPEEEVKKNTGSSDVTSFGSRSRSSSESEVPQTLEPESGNSNSRKPIISDLTPVTTPESTPAKPANAASLINSNEQPGGSGTPTVPMPKPQQAALQTGKKSTPKVQITPGNGRGKSPKTRGKRGRK